MTPVPVPVPVPVPDAEREAELEREPDRGSASLWVLGGCSLIAIVAVVGCIRGDAVLARHRAETAADLTALAAAGRIGVDGVGCSVAARVAAANGATLSSCRIALAADGRSGAVVVAVVAPVRLPLVGARTVTATARAAREPPARSTVAFPRALPVWATKAVTSGEDPNRHSWR